jgi:hypothetical protein
MMIIYRVVAQKKHPSFFIRQTNDDFFSQICSFGQIDTTNKYESLHTTGHYLS